MRRHRQSSSKKVVSAVSSFVAGTRLYGKPTPSTFSLELDIRRAARLGKQMRAKYGLDGKPPRNVGTVPSAFTDAWDTFMAYVTTALITGLKIALFFLFWILLLMAVPTILKAL